MTKTITSKEEFDAAGLSWLDRLLITSMERSGYTTDEIIDVDLGAFTGNAVNVTATGLDNAIVTITGPEPFLDEGNDYLQGLCDIGDECIELNEQGKPVSALIKANAGAAEETAKEAGRQIIENWEKAIVAAITGLGGFIVGNTIGSITSKIPGAGIISAITAPIAGTILGGAVGWTMADDLLKLVGVNINEDEKVIKDTPSLAFKDHSETTSTHNITPDPQAFIDINRGQIVIAGPEIFADSNSAPFAELHNDAA